MSAGRLGQRDRCYVIAEIGINHNGDVRLARELIDVAVDAGADAVKFQNYRTENFLSDRSLTYSYLSQGKEVTESQWDMFKRYELTGERLKSVSDHCRQRGIDFGSTPTDADGVRECVALNAAFIKNGSDYLSNLPLVAEMARTGLPTIVSTGMATVADIDDTVRAYRSAGGSDLYLLHCVSLYPAPVDTLDLRRIPVLGRAFECPVGFSDHSEGTIAATVAVALGACVIERHITLDKTLAGPDHSHSADPAEFRAVVEAVRAAESALGREQLGLGKAEEEARQLHRLSCVASRALPAGCVMAHADIAFRRPGHGLPPKAAEWVVGRRLGTAVPAGHIFVPDDFA